jgi:hypothetical protein
MHVPDIETVEQPSEVAGHFRYEVRRQEQAGTETLDMNRDTVF